MPRPRNPSFAIERIVPLVRHLAKRSYTKNARQVDTTSACVTTLARMLLAWLRARPHSQPSTMTTGTQRQLGKPRNQRWARPKTIEVSSNAARALPVQSSIHCCNTPQRGGLDDDGLGDGRGGQQRQGERSGKHALFLVEISLAQNDGLGGSLSIHGCAISARTAKADAISGSSSLTRFSAFAQEPSALWVRSRPPRNSPS